MSEIAQLIQESLPFLWEAFGRYHISIRRQDTEGEDLCRVVVLLPPDYQGDPGDALRRFDETWWLSNCHRANGNLVFDYEVTAPQP